ncbi:MAG: DUF262 domain-containing protein [Bacteroides sp.]|nr:DUF262 domain-containing protein [Bacteroides sp.]
MKLEIRSIASLLKYTFEIPNYQRGYRWDNDQVEDLLEDLKDFVDRSRKNGKNDGFYCLQPIVVVKVSEKKYIVVDGQQRLTTLYLLLHSLGVDKTYTLTLPGREKQNEFLNSNLFADFSDVSYKDNIDNFYLRKAYETIEAWKVSDVANKRVFKSEFEFLLSDPDTENNYVGVIWYDLTEDRTDMTAEESRMAAMAAFRRLNFGKIPLTSAELVKALLLQSDIYPDEELDLQKSITQRRSMEWDEMEHRLADSLFAAMVSKDNEDLKGIEIVLDIVAERINNTLEKPQNRKNIGKDVQDLFAFHVVYQKIREDLQGVVKGTDNSEAATRKCHQLSRSESVSRIWSMFQEVFNNLADWFENREWYHLIGFLRQMSSKPAREFITEISNLYFDISDIDRGVSATRDRQTLRMKTKSQFRTALLKMIGNSLRVSVAKKDGVILPDSRQGLNSPELRYDQKEQKKMINILIGLNVRMYMKDPNPTLRFPFHLLRKYTATSLEHIHPQNITENMDYETARSWFEDRKEDAEIADRTVWLRVMKSLEDSSLPFTGIEDDDIGLVKRHISSAISATENLMQTEESYDNHREAVFVHFRTLDLLFGDMAGIDKEELHSISNMALVTKEANSALSNNYLDKKREILSDTERFPFTPMATHKVFSKGFRPGNPGNMKFWTPEDRKAYMVELQEAYDYFTSYSK